MILAFPVDDNNGAESRISPDFGEAAIFFWYDTETENTGCAEHSGGKTNADSSRKAALLLSEFGTEAVIVNKIGCAAVNRLRGLGIDAYQSASENIKENIESFKSEKLTAIRSGDCDGSCR